jgi:hypothetical protein
LFLEVDRTGLGGRLLHDAFVVVPADVSLCGLEFEAGCVHLSKDLIEMAGFGLRVQREWRNGQNESGRKKRCSDSANDGSRALDHTSIAP